MMSRWKFPIRKGTPDVPVILCTLSGGMDSTYTLWYLLTKTENPIHVLHINLPHTLRYKKERKAVDKIIDYCKKNYREFGYSEITFDCSGHPRLGLDVDLVAFIAARIATNCKGNVDIAMGVSANDVQRDARRRSPHTLKKVMLHILESATLIYPRINNQYIMPVKHKWVTQMIKELPKELSKASWSCRKPDSRTGQVCRRCQACIRVLKAWENSKNPNWITPALPMTLGSKIPHTHHLRFKCGVKP